MVFYFVFKAITKTINYSLIDSLALFPPSRLFYYPNVDIKNFVRPVDFQDQSC